MAKNRMPHMCHPSYSKEHEGGVRTGPACVDRGRKTEKAHMVICMDILFWGGLGNVRYDIAMISQMLGLAYWGYEHFGVEVKEKRQLDNCKVWPHLPLDGCLHLPRLDIPVRNLEP
ncbi:hypothetical protein EMCG_07575 [[Emmonsia] crescens]|uniref:Uncharacterized protein n=1 Tax=[Emmonsia] crescens TaxID=73230 RepID=A0A0G2J5H4_9EURO|nr:hypothetical protein EMCG_07575 [Emmonsia crescens UAMH 3008]